MTTRQRSWPVPAAMVALSAVPLLAGSLRLVELAGGPAVVVLPDPRLTASPLPVVLHVAGAAVYAVLGAFQFVPRFRRRRPGWHRRAGRVLVVAGAVVAGSALWMTLLYPREPGTGDLLYGLRLVFGSAMAACLVLGVAAIRRRDVAAHRAWMTRAYAIALAAGTQAFTEGFGGALFGTGELRDDLYEGAGWVVDLAIAEWVVRRPAARPRPGHRSGVSPDAGVSHSGSVNHRTIDLPQDAGTPGHECRPRGAGR
jgi:uncharacterized membrane protein